MGEYPACIYGGSTGGEREGLGVVLEHGGRLHRAVVRELDGVVAAVPIWPQHRPKCAPISAHQRERQHRAHAVSASASERESEKREKIEKREKTWGKERKETGTTGEAAGPAQHSMHSTACTQHAQVQLESWQVRA